MYFQSAFLTCFILTLVAAIHNSCVFAFNMHFQIALLTCFIRALITAIHNSFVFPNMRRQISQMFARIVALVTFVWPFFTVYLHMFLQIICMMGCVITLITFERSFSSPSLFNYMFIQICSMWRSKLTQVKFLQFVIIVDCSRRCG